jgi:hypothetical protein
MVAFDTQNMRFSAEELLKILDDRVDDALWLPAKAVGQEFDDVPQHIAAAAKEAHECADVRAWRAAVLLARAVIEATAKQKDILEGSLLAKIDTLHEKSLIREHIKDGAHEIRLLGNEMAHGDFVEAVTAEDAEFVLTLMGELLEEVFQSPARVQRRREARQARDRQDAKT